jgi:hypothetical protein
MVLEILLRRDNDQLHILQIIEKHQEAAASILLIKFSAALSNLAVTLQEVQFPVVPMPN